MNGRNESGSLAGADKSCEIDEIHWTEEELTLRMEFSKDSIRARYIRYSNPFDVWSESRRNDLAGVYETSRKMERTNRIARGLAIDFELFSKMNTRLEI